MKDKEVFKEPKKFKIVKRKADKSTTLPDGVHKVEFFGKGQAAFIKYNAYMRQLRGLQLKSAKVQLLKDEKIEEAK